MKRKINRVGTNTLTVSLPSKWARKHGIKPGDELDVEEEGKSLIIGNEKTKRLGRKTIAIPTTKEFVKRSLYVPYVLGYDEIKIMFKENVVMEKVQETVEMMTGFEIMEQEKEYCVIKNIAKGEESKFDIIIRRLIHLLSTMGKELESGITKDSKILKGIFTMRKTVGKLTLFSRRILHVNGHKDNDRTIRYYLIVGLLEKISIYYNTLTEYYLKRNKAPTPDEIKLIKYVNDQFDFFVKIFFNEEKGKELAELKRRTWNVIHNNYFNSKKIDSYVLTYLVMILDKLNHITQEIY
jgi:phosphate uptake regulator